VTGFYWIQCFQKIFSAAPNRARKET